MILKMKQKVPTQARIQAAKKKDSNQGGKHEVEKAGKALSIQDSNGLRVQAENSGAPGISRRSNAEKMDFHRFSLKNN